jgi:hypothetical protein
VITYSLHLVGQYNLIAKKRDFRARIRCGGTAVVSLFSSSFQFVFSISSLLCLGIQELKPNQSPEKLVRVLSIVPPLSYSTFSWYGIEQHSAIVAQRSSHDSAIFYWNKLSDSVIDQHCSYSESTNLQKIGVAQVFHVFEVAFSLMSLMPIGPNEHISNNFVCYVDVYWLYIAPCGGGEKYHLGRGHANTTDNISLACMGMLGCLMPATTRLTTLQWFGWGGWIVRHRLAASTAVWRAVAASQTGPIYATICSSAFHRFICISNLLHIDTDDMLRGSESFIISSEKRIIQHNVG